MVGRPLLDVLNAFDIARPEFIERTARKVLETGDPVRDLHLHLRNRRDPAAEAVASAACFRLQDPDGTVLGLAVAITDITAHARADARLRLLNRPAMNVGTTLDIFRTAEELCDLAVPELADSMTVDVIDSVLRGEAPAPLAATETASLRRVGVRSAADDPQQGLATVGEVGTHPFGTPYLRALSEKALADTLPAGADIAADESTSRTQTESGGSQPRKSAGDWPPHWRPTRGCPRPTTRSVPAGLSSPPRAKLKPWNPPTRRISPKRSRLDQASRHRGTPGSSW